MLFFTSAIYYISAEVFLLFSIVLMIIAVLTVDVDAAVKFNEASQGAEASDTPPHYLNRVTADMSLFVVIMTTIIIFNQPYADYVILNGQFFGNSFNHFFKIFILSTTGVVLLLKRNDTEYTQTISYESCFLMLFSLLGMMLLVSASDFLSLYVSLELMTLPLYILAASARHNPMSTEAGIKYYIMSSVASAIILFSITLMYYYFGSTDLFFISSILDLEAGSNSWTVKFSYIILMIGFFFKMPAAPFHNWAPDVYEGAPNVVVAFFATAPKLAIFACVIQLNNIFFSSMVEIWVHLFHVFGLASIIVGSFGALFQTNLKRFLAYSSINHVGFMLLAISCATNDGLVATLLYIIIYVIMNFGFLAIIIGARKSYTASLVSVFDLIFLRKTQPVVAFSLMINVFSMAGVPPLLGFFSKYYVLKSMIDCYPYVEIIFILGLTVLSCLYYIRFVHYIYFTDRVVHQDDIVILPYEASIVLAITTYFSLFFGSFFLNRLIEFLEIII